jgi:hypothetical protein
MQLKIICKSRRRLTTKMCRQKIWKWQKGISAFSFGTINNNANFGQTLVGTSSIRNDSYYNGANVGASMLVFNNGRLEKNIRKQV